MQKIFFSDFLLYRLAFLTMNFMDNFHFGNYKLITANKDNFKIKAKIKRETDISQDNVLFYIPAENCCVYNEDYLI